MMRGWGPHGHPLGHTGPPDYSGLALKLSAKRAKNKVLVGLKAVLHPRTAAGKSLCALPFRCHDGVNRDATYS
jgi:hypothetical protein